MSPHMPLVLFYIRARGQRFSPMAPLKSPDMGCGYLGIYLSSLSFYFLRLEKITSEGGLRRRHAGLIEASVLSLIVVSWEGVHADFKSWWRA